MNGNIIKLTISIADRLVKNSVFMSLPEAIVLKNISRSTCPGCANKWRQKARRAVPVVMENIAKSGNVTALYSIVAGMYGNNNVDYRLPGTSKLVICKEGLKCMQ